MTDRPILFTASMVQALIAGRKRQTRRILKKQDWPEAVIRQFPRQRDGVPFQPGDRLWVREAWSVSLDYDPLAPSAIPTTAVIDYLANGLHHLAGKNRPSLFMPRWASRLTLVVTDVRVQRLQDISTEDAMSEGIVQTWGDWQGEPPPWALRPGDNGTHCYDNRTSVENFRSLWESIHGSASWESNPWVSATAFATYHCNVDDPCLGGQS